MDQYDAVLIGTGHNALVAGAYLARAGWRILMLEQHDRPGGLVRTEELTLPGFKHDVYSSAHPLFATSAAYADLGAELSARGLHYVNTTQPTGVVMPGERSAILTTDMAANVAEAERLAPGDGAAFGALMESFFQHAPAVFELFNLDLTSPRATSLIHDLMHGGAHRGYSPFAADFLATARDVLETRFQSEVMRGMLAPWVLHLGRTPDGANSGLWVALVLAAVMGGGMPLPVGGSEMLAKALVQLITDHGGEIRTHCRAEQIVTRNGQAVAVRVQGGDVYEAKRAVVASVNPDQLYLKLLSEAAIDPPLRLQAERYRYGRGCVQIQLALAEPPRWHDPRVGQTGQPHITPGLDGLAAALQQSLAGLLPATPTISFDCSTNLDPSRAPEGKAIVRLQMLEMPCRLRGDAAGEIATGDGSWTPDVTQRFAERVLRLVGEHVPNIPDAILGMHIITPDDLARFSPNQGPGDPYGGSHDLAQSYLLRPLPGQPSHQTAVPNVWMLGAATWPGHGINGGSGYIVAQSLLHGKHESQS